MSFKMVKTMRNSRLLIARMQHTLPGEPRGPSIKTKIPGPQTVKEKANLDKMTNADHIKLIMNLHKSIGNYLVDIDGNIFLDMYPQLGTLPIGYNHPSLSEVFKSKKNMRILINRPAMGKYPASYWYDKLHNVLISIAPNNMPHVTSMMCGSCAIENALKVMFIAHGRRRRGNDNFTQEEMKTAVINVPPGCPEVMVISLQNSHHTAMSAGANTLSNDNLFEKHRMLCKDWPVAKTPKYKYPLEQFTADNKEEDKTCANKVEEFILRAPTNRPVVGVFVQTIQECCHTIFSPNFIKSIQGVCQKHHVLLAIDENETGCGASGEMWDLTHLKLPEPPDIVTFGSKMQFGGYFRKDQTLSVPFRIFNTWMGEPGRILILEAAIKEIRKERLVENAKNVGAYLLEGLMNMKKEFPGTISYVTGRGLLAGIVCKSTEKCDELVQKLLANGVIVGKNQSTVVLRPCLTLTKTHCNVFFDVLRKSLKK